MAENTNTEREAFVQWMISDVLRSATKPVSDEMHRALRQTAERVWDSGEELVVRGWQARASLSLPVAGQEPVAWMDDRGLIVSAEWLASDEATSDYRAAYNVPLYAAPKPAVAAGWMPIATAPEGQLVAVGWLDREDTEHPERFEFDYLEDGCWMQWHEHAEHVEVIGGHGVSYTPPYTHWMPLGTLPPAPSTEGEARE